MFPNKRIPLLIFLLAGVCAAYSNHFHNSFHFDDWHTIQENPSIRSLKNVPRFFTDATTFSVLPANRTYRPFVSASLALDYALGRGYNVFWFHLSTFIVFLLQLLAMYALFGAILRAVRPERAAVQANQLVSLIAVGWYGLHPAMAETVNYIIQRGDIYATVGVVAALALYAKLPRWRKTGVYLLPFAFALLSKPPAVVFPVLLFLYIVLFEREGKGGYVKAGLAIVSSLIVCAALMVLQAAMTPKTFTSSTLSEYSYCVTQPYVLLHYFGQFLLPLHLNVDTDLRPFDSFNAAALAGFLFVGVLIAVSALSLRRRVLRPIAFGLLWFLITSLPTSLYRLSEVENDHRMFMPFVGLVLAATWAAYLAVERFATDSRHRALVWRSACVAAVLLLTAYAYGVHQRNRVWRNDATLWLDDVVKCPRNGRGLMNYGLTQMAVGDYRVALDYFNRAAQFTPNYKVLEVNCGIAHGAMNQSQEAIAHFERAIALDPNDDSTRYYYGRWLYQTGKIGAALQQLQRAVQLNPSHLPARDLLASAYSLAGSQAAARATAAETLRYDSTDGVARSVLASAPAQNTDYWINASLYQYQSGNYQACIDAAQQALKLNPNSELAYANIGAAYAGLKQWELAIGSERQALRIKPDFQLARNNLASYTRLKSGTGGLPANASAEEWLNLSLRDNQAGQYEQSIHDAEQALRLRPGLAEAYNNIAAGYASLGKWDEAIGAAQSALRLKPDFQLAKNNLAWAESQKREATGARP